MNYMHWFIPSTGDIDTLKEMLANLHIAYEYMSNLRNPEDFAFRVPAIEDYKLPRCKHHGNIYVPESKEVGYAPFFLRTEALFDRLSETGTATWEEDANYQASMDATVAKLVIRPGKTQGKAAKGTEEP